MLTLLVRGHPWLLSPLGGSPGTCADDGAELPEAQRKLRAALHAWWEAAVRDVLLEVQRAVYDGLQIPQVGPGRACGQLHCRGVHLIDWKRPATVLDTIEETDLSVGGGFILFCPHVQEKRDEFGRLNMAGWRRLRPLDAQGAASASQNFSRLLPTASVGTVVDACAAQHSQASLQALLPDAAGPAAGSSGAFRPADFSWRLAQAGLALLQSLLLVQQPAGGRAEGELPVDARAAAPTAGQVGAAWVQACLGSLRTAIVMPLEGLSLSAQGGLGSLVKAFKQLYGQYEAEVGGAENVPAPLRVTFGARKRPAPARQAAQPAPSHAQLPPQAQHQRQQQQHAPQQIRPEKRGPGPPAPQQRQQQQQQQGQVGQQQRPEVHTSDVSFLSLESMALGSLVCLTGCLADVKVSAAALPLRAWALIWDGVQLG